MRLAQVGLLALTFLGCGKSEEKFVPEFAELMCRAVDRCVDEAQRTFEGLNEPGACENHYTEQVARWQASPTCKFRKGSSNDCLDAVAGLQCPADGTFASLAVPAACGFVYDKCGSGEQIDDEEEDVEDEDEDLDALDDTSIVDE